MILNGITFDWDKIDSEGITIFIVGYVIVFVALVLLYYVFSLVPKIIKINVRKRLRQQGKHECAEIPDEELDITGEVNAAIGTAIYLFLDEQHDEESGILTVKRVDKRYSPWNSKIYSVMNNRLNR